MYQPFPVRRLLEIPAHHLPVMLQRDSRSHRNSQRRCRATLPLLVRRQAAALLHSLERGRIRTTTLVLWLTTQRATAVLPLCRAECCEAQAVHLNLQWLRVPQATAPRLSTPRRFFRVNSTQTGRNMDPVTASTARTISALFHCTISNPPSRLMIMPGGTAASMACSHQSV